MNNSNTNAAGEVKRTKRIKVVIETELTVPFEWRVAPDDELNPIGDCLSAGNEAFIPALIWLKRVPGKCSEWIEMSEAEEERLMADESVTLTEVNADQPLGID